MDRRTTERESRAALKADVARALVRVLFDSDVDQCEIASATGVTDSIAQRWCDRSRAETITVADVVLIGKGFPEVARGLLTWAADQLGLVVAPRLAGSAPVDHLQHAARIAREHSECLGAVLEAHADGRVDDDELARIDRELADVEAAHATLRSWVDAEKARRGLGLTEKRGDRVRQPAGALRAVGDERRDSEESRG